MKRLLCIVSCMDRGGAETFLMKVYRSVDKSKYQFDFCVNKEGFYDDEIKKMGGKIYIIPQKSKNFLKNFNKIKRIVKDNKYSYVLRTSQQSLAALDLLAAKFGGAKKLIYRSSNAGMSGSGFKKFINKLFAFLPRSIANVKIAPSRKAAEYVFGKKSNAHILNNGLDYDRFKYNPKTRKSIREELNILDDVTLYGHVGRFNVQKNHEFLIDIYDEINKNSNDTRLLLIGDGEEKEKIIDKVKELKLTKNVIFLEPKANIQDYFMAMDMLLFPSFYEGMPNVIIEAQATGLCCLLSDSITSEADITGLLQYKSLNDSKSDWAKVAISTNKTRVETYDSFKKSGYLIEDVVTSFIKIVFK